MKNNLKIYLIFSIIFVFLMLVVFFINHTPQQVNKSKDTHGSQATILDSASSQKLNQLCAQPVTSITGEELNKCKIYKDYGDAVDIMQEGAKPLPTICSGIVSTMKADELASCLVDPLSGNSSDSEDTTSSNSNDVLKKFGL